MLNHIWFGLIIFAVLYAGGQDIYNEFFNGTISVEGDLQYVVVYFDLLKLALEINKEMRGVL